MNLRYAVAAGIAALPLAGCVHEARMAVPSDFAAASERVELTGIGGFERGSFRLGPAEGSFSRSARRDELADGSVQDIGESSFIVAESQLIGRMAGHCGSNRTEIDSGILIHPVDRLSFGCDLDFGAEAGESRLVLAAAPRSPGRLLSGISRAGAIWHEGRRIGIRAVHQMEGGRAESGTPLGYSFDIDGRQIGAVDLNGGRKVIHAPRSGPEREAVLAASVALSIFWDPGE